MAWENGMENGYYKGKKKKERRKEGGGRSRGVCVLPYSVARTFFCENPATKQFVSSTQPVIRQIGNKINNVA